MIKINLRKILTFVVVCMAVVFVVSFGTRGKNYYVGNKVLKELPTQFKSGDDLSKVATYLNNNKLDRSAVSTIKNGKLESEDSRLENDEYIKKGAATVLTVLIPDIHNYGISVEGVLIAFYFDEKKKFMGYVVHKTGIAL